MFDIAKERIKVRKSRHTRIRQTVKGTPERPRLCVRRSLNHIVAQIVDDVEGKSLVQISTTSKEFQGKKPKLEAAKALGQKLGELAKEKGIQGVVFDRGGYLYHGRVKAVADSAREAGLQF